VAVGVTAGLGFERVVEGVTVAQHLADPGLVVGGGADPDRGVVAAVDAGDLPDAAVVVDGESPAWLSCPERRANATPRGGGTERYLVGTLPPPASAKSPVLAAVSCCRGARGFEPDRAGVVR
jgi:hypothetical protein